MKKSERIISAILTMVIGILLIVMKDSFIGLLMTVAGGCLIILGIVDVFHRVVSPAVVKIVVGVLIIVCGWALVRAVLYIVSAILLIGGILILYDKIKRKYRCVSIVYTVCEYAIPSVLLFIGVLLLFHQAKAVNLIFVLSGIFTVIEGGLLLLDAFSQD